MSIRSLLATIALCLPAQAHQAATGWTYPSDCCGLTDCALVPAKDVKVQGNGWRVIPRDLYIRQDQSRPSPDGDFHLCTQPTKPFFRCFFAPPGAY